MGRSQLIVSNVIQNGRLTSILDFAVYGICRWHGFWSVTWVCFGIFDLTLHMHVVCGHGPKPIDFQRCHFQNGRLAAILDFSVSRLTSVWLWISSPNFIGTLLMYRLVCNIRRTSNIRHTPTLGNSQLEFSLTISLPQTSNTRRTPSFDSLSVGCWQSVK